MGLLDLLTRKPKWAWPAGKGPPPPHVLQAATAVLRRQRGGGGGGGKAAAARQQVLQQLAALVDPCAHQQGRDRAAATAAALCTTDLLDAVAAAVHPSASPGQAAVEAAAAFATHMAAASPAAAAALGDSRLVDSLTCLLEAPHAAISPDAKLDILAFFRQSASRPDVRQAMESAGAPAAVVASLAGATAAGDWGLASEGAWALELMAGMSRRLTSNIGGHGGVEAALELLQAARQQQPTVAELPRDEEAAEAADTALHALLALVTDNRRNRVRARRAGGAAELAAAFQDERLSWESREQAAGMLQDLAAALLQDSAAEEEDAAAPVATPAAASVPSSAARPPAPPSQRFQREREQQEWQGTLLPALVRVLQQRRGQRLQESKEAAAGVLARYAANGPHFAAAVGESGALPPLLQLLHVGMQLAGGERRTAIAALQALEQLAGEPGCQQQMLAACVSAAGQLDLLGLLCRLLAAATAPELNLAAYANRGGSSGSGLMPVAAAGGNAVDGSGGGSSGGQVVAAGWHAAAVAARLCSGQQQLQDAAVARGLLPLLAQFVQAEVSVAAAAGVAATAGAAGSRVAELQMAIKCEVAGLLRSVSMRRVHHAVLRSCPGLLPYLKALVLPGAAGWTELKAAAKRVLHNLGEVQDTDRPLLTYTPHQLGALLQQQGIEARSIVERGVTGAEFVRLSDGDLRALVVPGQHPRVLHVLRAYESFSEIDSCGARSGSLGLAKLVTHLGNRGFRQAEVVLLAESLLEMMDGDRDDAVSFPDFLQCYDEFLARTMGDLQPPSKRRRTDSRQ